MFDDPFDGFISLGLLLQAYPALTNRDAIALAKRLHCKFGPKSEYKEYDLEDIFDIAEAEATDFFSQKREVSISINGKDFVWSSQDEPAYVVHPRWMESKKQGEKKLFDVMRDKIIKSYLFDIRVDKTKSVHLLDKHGFEFKHDVQGLTWNNVRKILAEEDDTSSSQPAIVEAVEEESNDKYKLAAQRPTLPQVMVNEITHKEAARLVGVSERTIYNWEKGKGRPPSYPGLRSRANFMVFAEGYKTNKALKGKTRAKNRAFSRSDIENFPDETEDYDY